MTVTRNILYCIPVIPKYQGLISSSIHQVPASVRVRRETVAPKLKAKSQLTTTPAISKPSGPTFTGKPETVTSSGAKSQSIDDSYMAFLEDMKALGALDG